MFKKADFILALILILLCGGASYVASTAGTSGTTVIVSVGGEHYGTYSLLEKKEISIEKGGHKNVISIENGTVAMISSDCSNQLCVRQGSISRSNQSIVCLPNQVVVEISGGNSRNDTSAPDAISR